MNRLKKACAVCTPLLALILGLPTMVQAQDRLLYQGPFEIDRYKGEAKYYYLKVGQDSLLDGSFQLQRSNLEALLEKEDAAFSITGAFNRDIPEGPWRFQFGEFQSESVSQVVDYQYRVSVSGTQQVAEGRMSDGRPDGPWKYAVRRIKDSEIDTTLFESTIEFEGGIPQRSFRIGNDKSTLVGRLLRNGLAHDEWSLFVNDEMGTVESWVFENGILRTIQIEQEGISTTTPVFDTAYAMMQTIPLDQRYLQLLSLYLTKGNTLAPIQGTMSQLLTENARYYNKIDTIFSKLGKASFSPGFKVQVPLFPLDSLEKIQLEAIKRNFGKSKTVSSDFLNDTQLNILRRSDKEAQFLYLVIQALSRDFLNPMEKVVSYGKSNLLEYVPRNVLTEKLWPLGKPGTDIKVNQGSEPTDSPVIFKLPNAAQFDFNGGNLASIQELSRYAAQSLDSIQRILDLKLSRERGQQELAGLEEQLITQSNILKERIDSAGIQLPGAHTKALLNIKKVGESGLSDYSGLKEVTAKLERARMLVKCLTDLNGLAEAIIVLQGQEKKIQETYQDRIWNPFTATLMDEEVKKRITTAYRNILTPYFLERVQTDLTCENARDIASLMGSTYERMLALRQEETSKLERKLRKERDPETVLRLFNLPSATKE
ncbi:hypothetical protein FK220_011405 [Flavobacteriaceae bacterium TP-CH-4]|uniref:Uncharacterized protein n=1 Tax=Pelagihabitans pacificus TaxID=2696054 RepID=A0A967B0M6_9FLAO|nr:hypothetical protein [Pelagihabitans pacificus]NHF59951.1 hypothetical protein [Pelagihabitans pacificus]